LRLGPFELILTVCITIVSFVQVDIFYQHKLYFSVIFSFMLILLSH